ncbi:MAG: ABC transporter ATP-binding protein [Patescibacteria group bacterium]
MPEQPGNPFAVVNPAETRPRTAELTKDRRLSAQERQNLLEEAKVLLKEWFGTDKLPKELLEETLDIRRSITRHTEAESYVEALSPGTLEEIRKLTLRIARFKDNDADEDRSLTPEEESLGATLEQYFDAFREAENARSFRNTVRTEKAEVVREVGIGKRVFYTEEARQAFAEKEFPEDILLKRLEEKYSKAGFTPEEIKELVRLCDIQDLHALPIHEVQTIKYTNSLFERYLKGEKGKFLALSVALMVPALIQGVAPSLLANAFKDGEVDITQIGLFGLAQVAGGATTIGINAWFEKFMKGNLTKPGGFNERLAENFTHFPGSDIREHGMDTIRRKAGNAQYGYEQVMRTVSYNLLPTITTLVTSVAVLGYKSPALAAGTMAGAGLMLVLDKQMKKRGKFWEKREASKKRADDLAQALSEQMSAHLETVLSGEKDKLQERLQVLMGEARAAKSEETLLRVVEQNTYRFFGALNAIVAAVVTFLTNGGSSGFVAAMVYSGNFNEGMRTMLETKRELLTSIQDIMEMELMFNGHAEEEKRLETERIGMDQVQGNDIVLDRITIRYKDRKILDGASARIQGGSFCSIRGESGGGKSTLLKIMSGYFTPTSGQAYFGATERTGKDGEKSLEPVPVKDIKKAGPQAIYRKMAYLSQFPYIFEGTIRDNLMFGVNSEVDEKEIQEILKQVGLTKRFPNLQEKLTGGRGDQSGTSGGETSRIGLARTLLKIRAEKSRVVFLDEPTASVDPKTKLDIARILNEEKAKHPETTFVIISHDNEFLDLLDLDQNVTSERGKLMSERLKKRPIRKNDS